VEPRLGDVELAIRRTFFDSVESGSIFAAGAAVALPTGKEELGLGNGYTIVEPFAMFGQMLGTAGFLQVHTGIEIPTDHAKDKTKRSSAPALGYSFAQDRGLRSGVVADDGSARRKPAQRIGGMGRRAADASVAEQAAACARSASARAFR
jgi:hypothetical protein